MDFSINLLQFLAQSCADLVVYSIDRIIVILIKVHHNLSHIFIAPSKSYDKVAQICILLLTGVNGTLSRAKQSLGSPAVTYEMK